VKRRKREEEGEGEGRGEALHFKKSRPKVVNWAKGRERIQERQDKWLDRDDSYTGMWTRKRQLAKVTTGTAEKGSEGGWGGEEKTSCGRNSKVTQGQDTGNLNGSRSKKRTCEGDGTACEKIGGQALENPSTDYNVAKRQSKPCKGGKEERRSDKPRKRDKKN